MSSFFRVGVAPEPRYTLKSSQATFQCHAGLSERVPDQLSPPNAPERLLLSHLGALGKRDFLGRGQPRRLVAGAYAQFLFPRAGEAVSYSDLLDSDQFR